jgi:hypothetical protein
MQEMHAAFRDICINELDMKAVEDPEMVLDAVGNGETSSIGKALKNIEARLQRLREHEVMTLEKISIEKELLNTSKVG